MSRVLVVEDDPSGRYLLCQVLKNAGYEVIEASDGAEALRLASEHPPDVVIADLFMPVMDGFSFLRKLRADPALRPVPVAVYSATYVEPLHEKLARSFGADAFILKPTEPDLLVQIIRKLEETGAHTPADSSADPRSADALAEAHIRVLMEKINERSKLLEEATAALKAKERLLDLQRRALDAAANGIVIADLEGNILWANAAFERLTGYTVSEAAGHNPRFLKSGVQPESLYEEMWRRILRGEVWHGELVNKRKDGTLYPEEMTITPIKDAGGRVVNFIAIKQDISPRRKTEQELLESRQLYRGIFHNHHIVMLLADPDTGRILDANPAAAAFYGRTQEELAGMSLGDLSAKPDSGLLARLSASARSPRSHVDTVQKAAGGQERAVEIYCAHIEGISRSALFCVVTDAEARQQLERELLRAQRLESVGTLAGGIAHDINNILAPIMLAAGLLKLDAVTPAQAQALETIENSAQRGADLVRQVLSFARGMGGERILLDLRHVARDISKIIADTFPKNITFTLSLPQEPALVEADPTQMHQVLMNLCVNSRDAMPGGGRIELAIAERDVDEVFAAMNPGASVGPHIHITVSDTGCGIPPEIQDRVFEPFFTTKDPGRGTGLGLSTVATIVRSHGGFIRLDSRPGSGTVFHIHIPKARDTAAAPAAATAVDEMPRGAGELILLVDDEESIREVTGGMLAKFGYRVLSAANGVEAVKLAARNPEKVALAIIDIAMPVMDGPAAIVALRALDPLLPVIVSSGHASEEDLARARQLGVKNFVPKPYAAPQLLKEIRSLLPQRAQRA